MDSCVQGGQRIVADIQCCKFNAPREGAENRLEEWSDEYLCWESVVVDN